MHHHLFTARMAILILLLLPQIADAQMFNYQADGKVAISDATLQGLYITCNSAPICKKLPDSNENKKVWNAFAKSIAEALNITIMRLEDTANSRSIFYDHIASGTTMPNRNALVAELTTIRTTLQQGFGKGLSWRDAHNYTLLADELGKMMEKDFVNSIFGFRAGRLNDRDTFSLVQRSLYSEFVLRYYKATVDRIFEKRLDDFRPVFQQEKKKLLALAERVNKMIAVLRDDVLKEEDVVSGGQLHKEIADFESGSKIKKFLQESQLAWQWLWLNGGLPAINPIDVLEGSVTRGGLTDGRATLYNQYIDSLLQRGLREGKLTPDSLRKLLALQGTGNQYWPAGPASREISTRKIAELQTNWITLNTLSLPVGHRADYQLIGYDAAAGNADPGKTQHPSITIDQRYRALVYNLSEGESAGMALTRSDSIPGDRSGPLLAIMDATSSLQSVVTLINPFGTGLAGAFNSMATMTSNVIPRMSIPKLGTVLANSVSSSAVSLAKQKLKQQALDNLMQLRLDSLYLNQYLQVAAMTTTDYVQLEENSLPTPPRFHSQLLTTDAYDHGRKLEYGVYKKKTQGSDTLGHFSFRTGKRYRFMISAGLAGTVGKGYFVNKVEPLAGGAPNISRSDDPVRTVIFGHYYPYKGVFLQDDKFLGRKSWDWLSRLHFTGGMAINKPLENIFLGGGYDFGPGIHLNTGVHLYGVRNYQIRNDVISEDRHGYRPAPFVSLTIDPVALAAIVGLFIP